MKALKHVIVGVTGSIAAYRSAEIVRNFVEKGFKVSVVMTKEAEYFITPLTFFSLSGQRVYTKFFTKGRSSEDMPHIQLAQTAQAMLIAQATANIIGKIACGLADDLLSCIVLATQAPLVIAPAMNVHMYNNAAVQENLEKLKSRNVKIIAPAKGRLACGVIGEGHIANSKIIVEEVIKSMRE